MSNSNEENELRRKQTNERQMTESGKRGKGRRKRVIDKAEEGKGQGKG